MSNSKKQIFIGLGIMTILCFGVLFLLESKSETEDDHQEIPLVGTLENNTTVKAIWIQFACDCPRWVAYEAYLDESYLEDNCEDIGACFSIEASNKAVTIPDTFYTSLPSPVLELSGRFYKKKQKFRGDDRYFYARLFQYDAYKTLD